MTFPRSLGFVLIVWCVGAFASAGQAIRCDAPLDDSDIKELVAAGVPPARLRNLIAACGLDLGVADAASAEARLVQLGAPVSILSALSPPPSPAAGAKWVSPFDQRQMMFVPAGQFRMGSELSEPNRDSDEEPHEVTIPAGFWIDTDEVTNQAYQRFVLGRQEWQKGKGSPELQGAAYLKDWNGSEYPAGSASAPVVWVTWHAARAYAAWAGKRLPTEREWEFAARAGSTARYWWGDQYDPQRVGGAAQSSGGERDLAALRTNPWGLRDMLGGIWEWTLSIYRPYPYVSTDGREDPRAQGARSIRGGSRANGEAFLRSANRNQEEALGANDLLGFRCAR